MTSNDWKEEVMITVAYPFLIDNGYSNSHNI